MRKWLIPAVLGVALCAATPARAGEQTYKPLSADDIARNETLTSYSIAAVGWIVNWRCRQLPTDRFREFRWYITQINKRFTRDYGPRNVTMILNAATRVGVEKYQTCNEETHKVSAVGLTHAHVLVIKNFAIPYEKGVSEWEESLQRLPLLLTSVRYVNDCNVLQPDQKTDFLQAVSAIENGLRENAGADAVERERAKAEQRIEIEHHAACGKAAEVRLLFAQKWIPEMQDLLKD